MALYIVNVIDPLEIPKIEFEPRELTWFKHDALTRKLLGSFQKVKPEYHSIYSSLLTKIGIDHKIERHDPPPQTTPAPPVVVEEKKIEEPPKAEVNKPEETKVEPVVVEEEPKKEEEKKD